MKLEFLAGPGLLDFVFAHGPLFASIVNDRDRELAPRKLIRRGVEVTLGPVGLVADSVSPHRLAIYDAETGGRMLFMSPIEPALGPHDTFAVSVG